jgi:hypothetical protein
MRRFLLGRFLFVRGLLVRIVAVLAGLLVASFVTFPSFSSTGLRVFIPAVSVDRTLKGDRLPLEPLAEKAMAPSASQTLRDKVPIGCDRAFSPISAPRLANVFRRCAA